MNNISYPNSSDFGRMDSANKILYKEESFKNIGACMKVHRALVAGFLEAVYEEALEKEFQIQEIPFKKQVKLDLYYNKQKLKKKYSADFVCYDKIILELKSGVTNTRRILRIVKKLLKMHKYGVGHVD